MEERVKNLLKQRAIQILGLVLMMYGIAKPLTEKYDVIGSAGQISWEIQIFYFFIIGLGFFVLTRAKIDERKYPLMLPPSIKDKRKRIIIALLIFLFGLLLFISLILFRWA